MLSHTRPTHDDEHQGRPRFLMASSLSFPLLEPSPPRLVQALRFFASYEGLQSETWNLRGLRRALSNISAGTRIYQEFAAFLLELPS